VATDKFVGFSIASFIGELGPGLGDEEATTSPEWVPAASHRVIISIWVSLKAVFTEDMRRLPLVQGVTTFLKNESFGGKIKMVFRERLPRGWVNKHRRGRRRYSHRL
jgi:hypothetical protein